MTICRPVDRQAGRSTAAMERASPSNMIGWKPVFAGGIEPTRGGEEALPRTSLANPGIAFMTRGERNGSRWKNRAARRRLGGTAPRQELSDIGRSLRRRRGDGVTVAPKIVDLVVRQGGAKEAFDETTEALDRKFGWDRLPLPLRLTTLVGLRNNLRARNLFDTRPLPGIEPQPAPPPDASHVTDGATSDGLDDPPMGGAGSRFGRNAPIQMTYRDNAMLSPSPRAVGLGLMTRQKFQPATTLDFLAAAWVQFMIRDWFSHGKSQTENPWLIPVGAGDDWHEIRCASCVRQTTHAGRSGG